MKTRKNMLAIHILAAVTLLLSTPTFSQVRIGEDIAPTKGTVLDLSSTSAGYVGGLKLPNVAITSLTDIPTTFKESVTSTADKAALAGLLVYNTNSAAGIIPGIYYWDGTKWVIPNKDANISITGNSPIVVNNSSSSSPSIGLINGTSPNQILKWSGSSWELAAAANNTGETTVVTGSSPITVSSNTSGNTTTYNASIADGAITGEKLANNTITVNKLPSGASSTTFLRGDGTWATPSSGTALTSVSGTSPIAVTTSGTESTVSLNDLGVTTAKLAARAVTAPKLFTSTTANRVLAVTSANSDPVYTQVTADMIANNAVTVAKLPSGATATTFLRGDGTWVTPSTGVTTETDPNAWKIGGNSNSSISTLGTNNNYDLPFVTNGTERMRLTTGGNLGIGTTAPAQKLHVVGNQHISGYLGIGVTGSTYGLHLATGRSFLLGTYVPTTMSAFGYGIAPSDGIAMHNSATAGSTVLHMQKSHAAANIFLSKNKSLFTMTSSSKVVFIDFNIGTTNQSNTGSGGTQIGWIRSNAGGTSLEFSGALFASSDIRLKENIVPTHYGLDDLLKIEVKDYNLKKDEAKKLETGFIAQEIYNVYPQIVAPGTDEDDLWMVDYGRITPLLVKSIQDQQQIIEQLEARIKILEAK